MKVVWLPLALNDLDAQIDHIAAHDPRAAVEQLDWVMQQAECLAVYPELGRPGRDPRTREWVVTSSPFILIYRRGPKPGASRSCASCMGHSDGLSARAVSVCTESALYIPYTAFSKVNRNPLHLRM